MAKISKSYILTLPIPQGHGMSVKCEEPIDELTVQVWLLYNHPNFNYWTLFVSGTELRTDRQTDRRTDGRTDERTDRRSDYWMPLADLSGRGHKNPLVIGNTIVCEVPLGKNYCAEMEKMQGSTTTCDLDLWPQINRGASSGHINATHASSRVPSSQPSPSSSSSSSSS